MSSRALESKKPVQRTALAVTRSPAAILRRQCACGECEECKKKEASLRRRAMGDGPATAPPIVHDVLRSSGRPLDAATRAFMEPRFGHDFGKVRVHADARSDESARAVNAFAYTVGQDIVFRQGQYTPSTDSGRKLVAHELAHVVQQTTPGFNSGSTRTGEALPVGAAADRSEHEADAAANAVLRSATPARAINRPAGLPSTLRRQTAPPQEQDVGRDKIVAVSKRTGDLTSRAWELVWSMLSRYFPEYVKSVAGVSYKESEPGVHVDIKESGTKDKKVQSAIVTVGKKFVEETKEDTLRDRIAQLGAALSGLKATPDPKGGKGTQVILKIIHEKFSKKANRIAGTSYDANLPGLRTEFKPGSVQAGSVAIAWSAPMLYFGSAFVNLPDADKEARVREEFKKIDKWAVENFQVRKDDLEDEDITLRIRGLVSAQLTTFRDKVQDPAVKAYATRLLTTTTPLEKGLQIDASGRATVAVGSVTIIVEPDVLGVPNQQGAVTRPDTHTRIRKPQVEGGLIKDFSPPEITITIRTSYGAGVARPGSPAKAASPDVISGYGRGTTASDKALGADKLRVHEGSHGLDLIQFVKDHPFPVFGGARGTTVNAFRVATAAFKAAVAAFAADMERDSVKRTDCTGITIDQFDDQHNVKHTVRCAP